MDINIETKIYDGIIEVIRDRTARIIVNTTDDHIKKGLKTLGWSSPEDVETLRAELEKYQTSDRILGENIEILKAENAKLIAERDRYKLIVLNTMRQKAVGEVTEDNGVLGAVFYKDAEMQLGETIYAIPVSALALQERIDILLAEREQWMKQVPVGEVVADAISISAVLNGHGYIALTIGSKLYALPAQQVPEGYTLVPIEPTEKMIELGARETRSRITTDGVAKEVYKAMLSAAPKSEDE